MILGELAEPVELVDQGEPPIESARHCDRDRPLSATTAKVHPRRTRTGRQSAASRCGCGGRLRVESRDQPGGRGRNVGRTRSGARLGRRARRLGELAEYHLPARRRAELLRRLGRHAEAAESYRRALALVSNEAERRHLEKRLREIMR